MLDSFDKKEIQYFEKDMVSFTALLFLKQNRKKYIISSEKQSQVMFWCLTMILLQFLLVVLLLQNIYKGIVEFFDKESYSSIWRLYSCKFVVNIILHLNISPYFKNGLSLMKFISNHPKLFDHPTIVYCIAFC